MIKWINKMLDKLDDLVMEGNRHKRYIMKGFIVFVVLFLVIILLGLFRILIVGVLVVAIMYMLGWLTEEIKEIRIRKEDDKPQYQQQDKKKDKGNKRE